MTATARCRPMSTAMPKRFGPDSLREHSALATDSILNVFSCIPREHWPDKGKSQPTASAQPRFGEGGGKQASLRPLRYDAH
jgi:hypothetical protein